MLSAERPHVIIVTAGYATGPREPSGVAAARLLAYPTESVKESSMLTLSEAQKSGRLEEFIAEQEAAGVGPIELGAFRSLAAALIKAPLSEDQTLRSASDGNSTGKKTRRGSGQGASH